MSHPTAHQLLDLTAWPRRQHRGAHARIALRGLLAWIAAWLLRRPRPVRALRAAQHALTHAHEQIEDGTAAAIPAAPPEPVEAILEQLAAIGDPPPAPLAPVIDAAVLMRAVGRLPLFPAGVAGAELTGWIRGARTAIEYAIGDLTALDMHHIAWEHVPDPTDPGQVAEARGWLAGLASASDAIDRHIAELVHTAIRIEAGR
jgi:hypothetical protein